MSKSVCIVSPSLQVGGIERMLTVLANYFIRNGIDVIFISCLNKEKFYELNPDIQLIEPDFKRNKGIVNKLIYYPRVALFLRRKVLQLNPDVILAFGEWFNPLVLLALYRLKYPVYISDRTSPDFKFHFPIPQLMRWLYPKSAGFIAQTLRTADFKRKQFGNKLNIRVIPNALRDVKIYPDIKREKIILYVGRLSWEKGPERLIRAFGAIPNREGWQLHMAGSGPLLNKMKQLVANLNISNEVVFYGKVQDVDQLFARAGIYILPSLREGFPNSFCEAMAAGLPCICFDKIPFEEIFTNGLDGIAIRDGDLDALTANIIRLIKDKQLREQLGTNAREIRVRLNLESIGNQVINFIFEK